MSCFTPLTFAVLATLIVPLRIGSVFFFTFLFPQSTPKPIENLISILLTLLTNVITSVVWHDISEQRVGWNGNQQKYVHHCCTQWECPVHHRETLSVAWSQCSDHTLSLSLFLLLFYALDGCGSTSHLHSIKKKKIAHSDRHGWRIYFLMSETDVQGCNLDHDIPMLAMLIIRFIVTEDYKQLTPSSPPTTIYIP